MCADKTSMLALQKVAVGPGAMLVEVPVPLSPGPGEVVVEVAAAGICGSDVHIYEWAGTSYASLRDALPITLGHEFAGSVVAAAPGVTSPRVGDRVTAVPLIGCGSCAACNDSRYWDCPQRQAVGLTRPGCFTRYVRLPGRACLVLPQTVSMELGALIEPLTIGAHAVQTGQVGSGHRVLIQGAGPIAQAMALFARRAGATQIVVAGLNDAPRFAVLRRLGFEQLVELAHTGAGERLAALAGAGFDVVLEAAGAPAAIEQGLRMLRRGGIFVAAGIHPGPASIDITDVVRRGLQIRGSYSASMQTWRYVISAVAEQPEQFAPIITHRLPLTRALEGFALAHERAASKVVLLP